MKKWNMKRFLLFLQCFNSLVWFFPLFQKNTEATFTCRSFKNKCVISERFWLSLCLEKGWFINAEDNVYMEPKHSKKVAFSPVKSQINLKKAFFFLKTKNHCHGNGVWINDNFKQYQENVFTQQLFYKRHNLYSISLIGRIYGKMWEVLRTIFSISMCENFQN